MRPSAFARSAFQFSLLSLVAALPVRADLAADAKAWTARHPAALAQAAKLTFNGQAAAANQLLAGLADDDGGPVAAFAVANALFRTDPAASYRLHLRALQALPNEPAALLEVAREQHRRGEYADAIGRYRQYLAAGGDATYAALLADCLVRTHQLPAAVQAWNQAGHDQRQAAIDAAIGALYGPPDPAQRRSELLVQVRNGDFAKLDDLILLDLNYESDWWTTGVFKDGLDADLKLAAGLLRQDSPRDQQLVLYAALARAKPADIREPLVSANLVVGPEAKLPLSSELARAFCELVVRTGVAIPVDLWTTHQAELRARVRAEDHEALHLLCWLAAATHNPELTDLDRLGWEDWNDASFARSYVIDLYREKKLTSADDSQLYAALAADRDDSGLTQLRIALAGDAVTADMIAATIQAEYRKLSPGDTGRRDSTQLNGMFYELGRRL